MAIALTMSATISDIRIQLPHETSGAGMNQVARIDNHALYITDARITDTLSIGTEQNGWFDWVTLGEGLALKWRSGE